MKNISILGSGKSIEGEHVILALSPVKATDNIRFPAMKTHNATCKSRICRSLAWGVKMIFSRRKHLKTPYFSFKFPSLTPIFWLNFFVRFASLVPSKQEKRQKYISWQTFSRSFHVMCRYQTQLDSGSWFSSSLMNKMNAFNCTLCLYGSIVWQLW